MKQKCRGIPKEWYDKQAVRRAGNEQAMVNASAFYHIAAKFQEIQGFSFSQYI